MAFPRYGKYWSQFAALALKGGDLEKVEQIIGSTLTELGSRHLWKFYVNFVIAKSEGDDNARETIQKAFEFALSNFGFSLDSGDIWGDYIAFLKKAEAKNEYDRGQRLTSLRRAYQQAVTSPTREMEKFWEEYQAFENAESKVTAVKFLGDYQPKFAQMLKVKAKRASLWAKLDDDALAVPPASASAVFGAWEKLVDFEMSNPEQVSYVELEMRVRLVFKQSLGPAMRCPDMWFKFASYEQAIGDEASARAIFERAGSTIPESDLMGLVWAEFEEECGHVDKAKTVYDGLLERGSAPAVLIQCLRFTRRTRGVAAAREFFAKYRSSSSKEVFVAAALLEYEANGDKTCAINVFEMGMRKYERNADYVLEYVALLKRCGSADDVRAIFERSVRSGAGEAIWRAYVAFESHAGCAGENALKKLRDIESRMKGKNGLRRRAMRYGIAIEDRGKAPRGASSRRNGGVPHFLAKLVDALPSKLRGVAPDPDYVMRILMDGKSGALGKRKR